MTFSERIKEADLAIQKGYLDDAKVFFSKLLFESNDPVYERIAKNRLGEISKKLVKVKDFFQFDIEYIKEKDDFLFCSLRCIFKEPHLKNLIADIFANSRKKNYPRTSSIEIKYPAVQQIIIELSGFNCDSRCEWCKTFRTNILYYAGSKNIYRHGHCPIGIEI